MRRLAIAAGLFVMVVGARYVKAQETLLVPAAPQQPLFLDTVNPSPFVLPAVNDTPLVERKWPFAFDIIIGLPTGVRAQVPLSENANGAWLLEGFVGLQYVLFPEAGVGIRRRFTPVSGERDAFTICPGMGVYALLNPFARGHGWLGGGPDAFGSVAIDLDINWRHAIGRGEEFQIGTKIGLAGFFGSDRGSVAPIIAVFFGLGF